MRLGRGFCRQFARFPRLPSLSGKTAEHRPRDRVRKRVRSFLWHCRSSGAAGAGCGFCFYCVCVCACSRSGGELGVRSLAVV